MSDHRPIVALGFSPEALPLLERLAQSLAIADLRRPGAQAPEPGPWLAQRWSGARAVLAVGACGLVTRLVAPLLGDKTKDPAVLVIDPPGRFVVPLLGGHGAGGEALAEEIAALLGATAVLTGAAASAGRLPLDSFARAWGWRRGDGDWHSLMQHAGRGEPIVVVRQQSGQDLWRQLDAARGLDPLVEGGDPPAELVISSRIGPGCRWHPPCLWLGMGCERDTSPSLLERLVDDTLHRHGLAAEAVAGLASAGRKGDEAALLALSHRRGWPLRLYDETALAAVVVPNPSAAVAAEMGTASVAEAAAMLAAGTGSHLVIEKIIGRATAAERGAATLAVAEALQPWAPARGALHLVGSGPGALTLLTPEARAALARCCVWVGYGPYLDLLEPLRRPHQLRRDGRLTAELERCREAIALARQGVQVALISSGDSGIYGMAGLALELWLGLAPDDRPPFQVHPGVSALQLAAARAGAPLMHDLCTISLSDRLTPWDVIEGRLRAAAAGDFVVALYNPRSADRHWQLERARQLLLAGRGPATPVLIARQLGRPEETTSLHTLGSLPVEAVDMLTLVLVGNSATKEKDGWMVTPRGYPGAELS